MVLGIQLGGIAFLLIMLYLTYLYYKKGVYTQGSAIFWIIIWGAAMTLLTLHKGLAQIINTLQFSRVMDLYLVVGMIVLLGIVFYDYVKIEKQERKLEELVRQIALKRSKK